jgi:hypothetical protein
VKANWCAALIAVLVLGGCTTEAKPDAVPGPSAAPSVAPEEVVPAGYFRKPKDGEVCKKVDLTPLQAVLPGISVGPASGVFQDYLKCDYTISTSLVLGVAFRATMFDSAEQAAKELDFTRDVNPDLRTITLPVSKAQALVSSDGLGVFEQNMSLSGGAYATDKAMLTERLAEAVHRTFDALLVILRKEFQATTGPSPTAQPQNQRRVVSPNAFHGRMFTYDLDPSPTVAATYGSSKSNNVMIFAAALTIGALCLWRDNDSIGMAVVPGQKPADVKADFLTLRRLATTG